jgi:NAD(P)-dependent dehydrogenase (short-subunit alcohol dehydrogenase family)
MTEPVLVTGAGSGIGLAIVQALRAAGRPVWAGARRDVHLQQLAGLGAWPLRLDVREPVQVQAAAAAVHAHRQATGQGLAGLVHNAGVGGIAPLAGWPDDDLLALFDTNVFGPHRLTNALLPALQAAQGRIVCIGSMGGSITSPTMGPYTMSKHALEAYAECLRQELAPHGVAVSIVQPGAVATDIGDNGARATWHGWQPRRRPSTRWPLPWRHRSARRSRPTWPPPSRPRTAATPRRPPWPRWCCRPSTRRSRRPAIWWAHAGRATGWSTP